LPLVNLNQDQANDYFADGLTGEIIRNLSIIDGLAVRSETSSFTFRQATESFRRWPATPGRLPGGGFGASPASTADQRPVDSCSDDFPDPAGTTGN
jgi:hypothetical protein